MLTVEHLRVAVGSRILFEDFNAQWLAGTLVCVLGENGIGKTTLLNQIAGVSQSSFGSIRLFGDDVLSISAIDRASLIASIAQHDSADLETLVYDRISHGLFSRRKKSSLAEEEERLLIDQIAKELDIQELLPRPLYSLSGGQRKKTHIARCLVDDQAAMYILDEPDAGLDANARDHMLQLLKTRARSGKLVLASMHHRTLAHTYADNILDLSQINSDPSIIVL